MAEIVPKKKDEQVKNLEWTKLKGLLGEKALDRQSKEKQHSEELGFKSEQLQAQKQQNSFDNKLKLAELIGKKPSKKSIYTTVAENFGSKGYGAFFKGLFSALGHKDQEEMSEKQASEMMKYLQQAEAIDYIKNTNEQLDQMYKKAQLQKQADEYFQSSYEKILNSNLPNSEKQNVIGRVVKRAGEMAGEQKTLDGIGNNGDLYIQNQKGNIVKVAVDPVENAISNYRDLQNNYQYPQSNSSNPYQQLVNDQNQTRINYDQNGRMRTQQPQNPIQAEQRQENLQQNSQQEQPQEEPWMKYMSEAENNVYREPNASEYKPEELKPFIKREAQRLYFEDQKEQKKIENDSKEETLKAEREIFKTSYNNLNKRTEDGELVVLKNFIGIEDSLRKVPEIEDSIKNSSNMGSPFQSLTKPLDYYINPKNNSRNALINSFSSDVLKGNPLLRGNPSDNDLAIMMRGVPDSDKPKDIALKLLANYKNLANQKLLAIKNDVVNLQKKSVRLKYSADDMFNQFDRILSFNGDSKNLPSNQSNETTNLNLIQGQNPNSKINIYEKDGKAFFQSGDKQVELSPEQVGQIGGLENIKSGNLTKGNFEFTNDQLQTLGLSEKKTTNPIIQNVGHYVGAGLTSIGNTGRSLATLVKGMGNLVNPYKKVSDTKAIGNDFARYFENMATKIGFDKEAKDFATHFVKNYTGQGIMTLLMAPFVAPASIAGMLSGRGVGLAAYQSAVDKILPSDENPTLNFFVGFWGGAKADRALRTALPKGRDRFIASGSRWDQADAVWKDMTEQMSNKKFWFDASKISNAYNDFVWWSIKKNINPNKLAFWKKGTETGATANNLSRLFYSGSLSEEVAQKIARTEGSATSLFTYANRNSVENLIETNEKNIESIASEIFSKNNKFNDSYFDNLNREALVGATEKIPMQIQTENASNKVKLNFEKAPSQENLYKGWENAKQYGITMFEKENKILSGVEKKLRDQNIISDKQFSIDLNNNLKDFFGGYKSMPTNQRQEAMVQISNTLRHVYGPIEFKYQQNITNNIKKYNETFDLEYLDRANNALLKIGKKPLQSFEEFLDSVQSSNEKILNNPQKAYVDYLDVNSKITRIKDLLSGIPKEVRDSDPTKTFQAISKHILAFDEVPLSKILMTIQDLSGIHHEKIAFRWSSLTQNVVKSAKETIKQDYPEYLESISKIAEVKSSAVSDALGILRLQKSGMDNMMAFGSKFNAFDVGAKNLFLKIFPKEYYNSLMDIGRVSFVAEMKSIKTIESLSSFADKNLENMIFYFGEKKTQEILSKITKIDTSKKAIIDVKKLKNIDNPKNLLTKIKNITDFEEMVPNGAKIIEKLKNDIKFIENYSSERKVFEKVSSFKNSKQLNKDLIANEQFLRQELGDQDFEKILKYSEKTIDTNKSLEEFVAELTPSSSYGVDSLLPDSWWKALLQKTKSTASFTIKKSIKKQMKEPQYLEKLESLTREEILNAQSKPFSKGSKYAKNVLKNVAKKSVEKFKENPAMISNQVAKTINPTND